MLFGFSINYSTYLAAETNHTFKQNLSKPLVREHKTCFESIFQRQFKAQRIAKCYSGLQRSSKDCKGLKRIAWVLKNVHDPNPVY